MKTKSIVLQALRFTYSKFAGLFSTAQVFSRKHIHGKIGLMPFDF